MEEEPNDDEDRNDDNGDDIPDMGYNYPPAEDDF